MGKLRTPQQQGEENKKLGLIAQKEFDGWCTPADLTANKSTEDDEGWDFFIQAKSSNEPRPFLDRKPPAFSALVQVKGTADGSGRFRMTPANALKLVINQLGPAFAFVAHVDGDRVRKAWLVHCNKEFIEKVLKAAVNTRRKKPLNERWLTFRPERRDVITRRTLRRVLEGSIGNFQKYFDWKKGVVSNAGYEDGRFEVRIREVGTTREEFYERLADFVLGLRDLAVTSADVFDVRFGEARLKKKISRPTLSRPVVPSEPDTDIVVEGDDGESVTVSCSGYLASAYVPFLPQAFNRLRLVGPFLELVVGRAPKRRNTQMVRWSTPGLGTAVTAKNLDDKARAAAVMRLVRRPGTTVTLRTAKGVAVPVPLDGRWVWDARSERAFRYFKALEDFRVVIQSYGLPRPSGSIEPDTLVAAADQLHVLASIAAAKDVETEVQFPKTESPGGVGLGERVSFVFVVLLRLPEAAVVVVTVVTGDVASKDKKFFHVRGVRLARLRHRLVKRPTKAILAHELREGARTLERLGGAGRVFLRPPPVLRGERSALKEKKEEEKKKEKKNGSPKR